jgi:glycosyltransferase involved in cell wall biosynthesis
MNILIINHYAGNPNLGMEFRPYYLSKEWLKSGHNVSIIASNYSHLRTNQPVTDKDLTEEIVEGIRYIWIATPRYSASVIKRFINILVFVLKLFWYKTRLIKLIKPDVVIASSTYPLDIYPAYYYAKKNKAKLCFELHDMWPLSPMIIGGYSKYHPFIWLMQKAENFACRKVDCYVSMLGNVEEYLAEHGLEKSKFIHIPNGFNSDERKFGKIELPENYSILLDKLRNENKVIVGYAGGHSPSNALDSLIDAASLLRENDKIVFVLVGTGPSKDALINKVKKMQLDNVIFLPPVIKQSVPSLVDKFDMVFIGGIRSELHKYGTSPNKITEYILAEKPVIFSIDEPNSLIEKVGCGYRVPAEDAKSIADAIYKMSTISSSERKEMGIRGSEYAIKNLNYEVLAEKFIQSIEAC